MLGSKTSGANTVLMFLLLRENLFAEAVLASEEKNAVAASAPTNSLVYNRILRLLLDLKVDAGHLWLGKQRSGGADWRPRSVTDAAWWLY
jgi:hypothetical protein